MESNNKLKNVILAVLVVGLVGMTIAYAGLTQQLLITNNQVTVSSKWRVRFNETVTATPYGTASVETQATTSNDRATISGLRATLKKPGDYVEVAFTVQNEGNIAAKGQATTISPITLTCTNGSGSNVSTSDLDTFCGKLVATVTHADGTPFSSSDTLAAATSTSPLTVNADGGSIAGKIKIEYPSSLENSDITAINGQNVTVTLNDVYLYFEQN